MLGAVVCVSAQYLITVCCARAGEGNFAKAASQPHFDRSCQR